MNITARANLNDGGQLTQMGPSLSDRSVEIRGYSVPEPPTQFLINTSSNWDIGNQLFTEMYGTRSVWIFVSQNGTEWTGSVSQIEVTGSGYIELVLVGGGGAGGNVRGGGGGGGGINHLTNLYVTGGKYNLVLGDGGRPSNTPLASTASSYMNGKSTTAFGQVIIGGGHGACYDPLFPFGKAAYSLGCGGGGYGENRFAGALLGGTGSVGYGGGTGSGAPYYNSAGGGGMGGSGSNGGINGGDGGAGTYIEIISGGNYFGGGGGGGAYTGSGGTGSLYAGNGGKPYVSGSSAYQWSGAGGGGGGGDGPTGTGGGNGSAGVIMISYERIE